MNAPLELWLVRHGETIANADKRISGWTDVPLSNNGKIQAKGVAPLLQGNRFDGVWASDLQRAVHTAQIAYGDPVVDNRLREMHFGELENETWESADPVHTKALLDFVEFSAPGGENLVGFRARLVNFIDTLCRGRHLIFTHGGVIRMLTNDLGHDRFVKNASLVRLDWAGQKLLSIDEPG